MGFLPVARNGGCCRLPRVWLRYAIEDEGIEEGLGRHRAGRIRPDRSAREGWRCGSQARLRANTLVRAADPDGDRPGPVRLGPVPGPAAHGPRDPGSLIPHGSRQHRVAVLSACPIPALGRRERRQQMCMSCGCSEPHETHGDKRRHHLCGSSRRPVTLQRSRSRKPFGISRRRSGPGTLVRLLADDSQKRREWQSRAPLRS